MKYLIKRIIPKNLRPAFLNTYYHLRAPFFAGNLVHCPCCQGDFKKFASFNSYGTIRQNAQCPKCGSLERHRLLWLYLKNSTNILEEDKRLLHIAPEAILQAHFKQSSKLDYISADIDSPLADIKMNIQDIPYENNYVDAILCYHVLDHVDDDKEAMREMFRVLKPGGWAIIQSSIDINREITFDDPNARSPEQRLKVFGQADRARRYGLDFPQRLENSGFRVEKVQYAKEQVEGDIARYGLSENDTFYLCTKQEDNAMA
ncbi:class I SAM-dependent methyltransferase [Flavobacteriales bacterium AH-315-E23]|nr:class I SAM-dependent methyltransferase [Flavobacteriales bacterium AH-315-E23]